MKSDNEKSSLRYAWLLVLSFFVLCSCSPTKPQKIFNQPVSPPVEIDYARLGGSLVGLLSVSLEPDGLYSVESLKRLARDWQPLADEKTIDREVFFFHMFLLIQACAEASPNQSVINRVVAAFYASLEQALVGDIQSPLYVTEFIRSHIGTDPDTLAELRSLWVTRAQQYEAPFGLDLEDYLESRPGHLPWKRLILRFMQTFREPQLQDIWREATESVPASVAVTLTFGLYSEKATEIIVSHFGQKS